MFCTNCGASNQEDATSCANCGESLSEIEIGENLSRTRGFRNIPIFKKADFLRALFSFSFNPLLSLKAIKCLYGLSVLSAGLIALLVVMMGFKISMWFGIFSLLIGAPLIFFLIVIYSRVLLEMILTIFRIADHMNEIGLANLEEKSESRDSIQWNI